MRILVLHRRRLIRQRPKLAVYLSSHGFGHFVRAGAVLEALEPIVDYEADVFGPWAEDLWPPSVVRRIRRHPAIEDPGVVQADDLHVDAAATRHAIEQWLGGYEGALARETARLATGFDLVLGDVPPLAFDAAAQAGVASVALANFSWDWIYRAMGFAEAAERGAAAYAKAGLLLSLEPAAPMEAFLHRREVGLLGRRPRTNCHVVRSRIGLTLEQRVVLVAFRRSHLVRLPAPTPDIVYLLPAYAEGWPSRDDVVRAPACAAYIDLVAAADVVVSKPGYGILGDTAGCGTPLLWTARSGFPEDSVLESWLGAQGWATVVEAASLAAGRWAEPLVDLLSVERPDPTAIPGAEAAARAIGEMLTRQ